MGYARYIGRVGALAVGLGVGVAVATISPATAAAAPPGDSSPGASPSAHTKSSGNSPHQSVNSVAAVRVAAVSVSRSVAAPRAGLAAGISPRPHVPKAPTPLLLALAEAARRGVGGNPGLKTGAVTPITPSQPQSPNLLLNSGAEFGDPSLSGYASVTIPGWSVTGTPTVIRYNSLRRLPGLFGAEGITLPAVLGFPTTASAPVASGSQFFGGGNVATSTLTQTVDLSGVQNIDSGTVSYNLGAALGGYFLDPSRASVTVNFLDANSGYLGSGQIAPVSALNRWFQTGLQDRAVTGSIPTGTRTAQVVVKFTDLNPVPGSYNNAYADDISFTVGDAALAQPDPLIPPASNVGALDHVFMIYMENKGAGNVVGSPNAPYINSLIAAYGSASNYYALTHPSDPNYYPILGGSDYGVNYNCAADCFDVTNLADNIDAAGKTWAAYQQGGGGYSTPTDRTPFLAFHDIYDDPARVDSHIFDLSQLGTDLESTNTAPNFAWVAADEDHNMEGPIDTLGGVLSFALSQLTTQQYNVAAGDAFLQATIPTIYNSAVWNDPIQSSAIFLTFDEDNNNISFGFGNEGNHVVMVVIPSPGAVAAGMRGGAFAAGDYYNHYSLQRTIELSLGVQPLTNNDGYAQPMNEFWT